MGYPQREGVSKGRDGWPFAVAGPAPTSPQSAPPDGLDIADQRAAHLCEEALAAVKRLARADSAHLIAYDHDGGEIAVAAGGVLSEGALQHIAGVIAAKLDPYLTAAPARPQWIGPSADNLTTFAIRLAGHSSRAFVLALGFRRATPVARLRVARLAPDLATLLDVHLDQRGQIDEAVAQRATASVALDHGECGVLAVRADHSPAFMNKAASQLLAAENGVHVRRGTVRPTDFQHAARFHAALDTVISAPDGQSRPRAFVMLLTDPRKARPMIAVLAPARSGGQLEQRAHDVAAIIYLLEADGEGAHGLDTLCGLLGLSRVEARLMAHLHAGLTVSEAAAQMRIKVETARAYLKQIFGKTDTHRQTELVALFSRYLRAIRGQFDFHAA